MIIYKTKSGNFKKINLKDEKPFEEFINDLKLEGIISCEKSLEEEKHPNDDEIFEILQNIIKESQTYIEQLEELKTKFIKKNNL